MDAQTRLNHSRLQLELVLLQQRAGHGPPDPAGNAAESHDFLAILSRDPTLRVLLQIALAWWAQQPLKSAAGMASGVARSMLHTVAQRHPVRLVLGAAAIGGAIVLLKPWRWISVPTLAAGLAPQLLSKLLTSLRPVSWAEVLAHWLQASDKRGPTP